MSGTKAILDQLPDSDLRLLAEKWVERRYEAHQLVIEHGDSNCDVFFLLEGRARVTLFTETGREVAYREMGRGDIFGELAGIDGKARSASIVALEPARVARLPQAQFQDFDPFWEFVAGPLHAGTFGPNELDNTFGPEVKFIKAPGPGRQNLPPSAGMQFFGHVRIDGGSGQMTVTFRDRADVALWSITLDPKPA